MLCPARLPSRVIGHIARVMRPAPCAAADLDSPMARRESYGADIRPFLINFDELELVKQIGEG